MDSSSGTPPSPLVLKPATVADIDEIMEVERCCFRALWKRKQYAREITRPDRYCHVVARWEGRLVGYAAMYLIEEEAHISTLGVLPPFRRRGIGGTLLQYLLKWARRRGAETVSLEVRESNLGAQNMYRRQGFVEVGMRPHYYSDNRENALIMVRDETVVALMSRKEE